MRRFGWVALALVFLMLAASSAALAEKRIALLIGNKDYKPGVCLRGVTRRLANRTCQANERFLITPEPLGSKHSVSAAGKSIASRESVWMLFLQLFRRHRSDSGSRCRMGEGGDFVLAKAVDVQQPVLGEHADAEPV